MSTEQLSVPQIEYASSIPLQPKFRGLPLVSPSVRENVRGVGRIVDFVERITSHRFDLVPKAPAAQTIFDAREKETGYIYRQGLRGEAKLVHGSYGTREKGKTKEGAYEVPTRWVGTHIGALSSYLLHHGEWALVTFPKPTENPPERLALPRKEKSRISRLLQRPTKR